VIQELYRQQYEMHKENKRSIEHRIVSIHQPHVRPILRGKDKARTEFGAKVNASTIDGFTFIDQIQWENYNESTFLQDQVEQYQKRFKCLPKYLLADRIYLTRANRAFMKALGIMITGKPLGRPPKKSNKPTKALKEIHNQRNHIEGKFGQLKRARHLNINKAKLAVTSFSWIAASFFITNLLTLAKSHFILFMLLITLIITQAKRQLTDWTSLLRNYVQDDSFLAINMKYRLHNV
ncbi:MAG: transposase, partial [Bacteroidia bacterium]